MESLSRSVFSKVCFPSSPCVGLQELPVLTLTALLLISNISRYFELCCLTSICFPFQFHVRSCCSKPPSARSCVSPRPLPPNIMFVLCYLSGFYIV